MFVVHDQILSKSDWDPSNSLYYSGIAVLMFKFSKEDVAAYKKESSFFVENQIESLLKKTKGGFVVDIEIEFELTFPDTTTNENGWILLTRVSVAEQAPGKGWKDRATYKKVISDTTELAAKLMIKDGYKEKINSSEDLENHKIIETYFEKYTKADGAGNTDPFLEHLKYFCFIRLDSSLR